MRKVRQFIPNAYIALVFLFLYLPIIVLMVFSFNRIPKSFVWGGFSIDNYANLFGGSDGSELLSSLLTTLKVATIASLSATSLAVISCIGLSFFTKRIRNATMNITYIPNIMPELVTGISFMLLFSFLGIQKG